MGLVRFQRCKVILLFPNFPICISVGDEMLEIGRRAESITMQTMHEYVSSMQMHKRCSSLLRCCCCCSSLGGHWRSTPHQLAATMTKELLLIGNLSTNLQVLLFCLTLSFAGFICTSCQRRMARQPTIRVTAIYCWKRGVKGGRMGSGQ